MRLQSQEHSHLSFEKKEKDLTGTIPLAELEIGSWCKVAQVGGTGALRRRLLDMGITPNTRMLLRKTAPLGDPMEFHLRGYDLSLRKEDASRILVWAEK